MLLIGDIGGTRTTLALVPGDSDHRHSLSEKTFSSAEYSSLGAIIAEFLNEVDDRPGQAIFGVAGPVMEGRAVLTNLPWVVDQREIEKNFGFSSVQLLNDLEAVACAVPFLLRSELLTINEGSAAGTGNMAVVAPGTGLGEAFLTWDGERYQVHPSEGGHADFAPRTAEEMELLAYLMDRFDHVSYERVCSGPGIAAIYSYLRQSGYAPEPDWLAQRYRGIEDPTPIIVGAALDDDHRCDLCIKALDMFVSILGAEAGNIALMVMATGGVYLGGGIPPRITSFFQKDLFMESFLRKGRYSGFLEKIPVRVILNTKAPLLGAIYWRRMKKSSEDAFAKKFQNRNK